MICSSELLSKTKERAAIVGPQTIANRSRIESSRGCVDELAVFSCSPSQKEPSYNKISTNDCSCSEFFFYPLFIQPTFLSNPYFLTEIQVCSRSYILFHVLKRYIDSTLHNHSLPRTPVLQFLTFSRVKFNTTLCNI